MTAVLIVNCDGGLCQWRSLSAEAVMGWSHWCQSASLRVATKTRQPTNYNGDNNNVKGEEEQEKEEEEMGASDLGASDAMTTMMVIQYSLMMTTTTRVYVLERVD